MAEPLTHQYGIEVVENIATMVVTVAPKFEQQTFVDWVLQDYLSLELMDRARKIAEGLSLFLPANFNQAVGILLASTAAQSRGDKDNSMASFIFLPHSLYVAKNGLCDLDTSMQALYLLT
jgi:hypothetical protein